MSLVSLLVALVLSVQPVYVYLGEEPEYDPQKTLKQMEIVVDQAFLDSTRRDLVVDWDEVESLRVSDSSWDTVHDSLSRQFDDKRVIAAVEQGESDRCGLSNIASTVNEDRQTVAVVWERCWEGRLFLHELLHASSAISPDAPSSEGYHSTNSDDVMYPRVGSICGDPIRIDCLGDSYFNPSPVEGSWLDRNPENNIINAEYLEPKEASTSDSESDVQRIAGSNRFQTAVAISQQRFSNGSTRVFIANGSAMADALTGSGMLTNAPLLLVTRDQIPDSTHRELLRLDPGKITIFGGRAVVSDQVRRQLEEYVQ